MGGRPGSGRFERAQAAGVAGAGADDMLGHCPGLILWPSMFIPMPPPELAFACAAIVVDLGEGDTQSEAAMEALWEYQNFLRERFNPPPDDPSWVMSDALSSAGDANSIHNSIFSVSSVGTEALDVMWEYLSELNTRFEVPPERARPVRGEPMPTATQPSKRGSVAESTSTAATSSTDSGSTMLRPCKSRSRGSRGRDPASTVLIKERISPEDTAPFDSRLVFAVDGPTPPARRAHAAHAQHTRAHQRRLRLAPHMGRRHRALDVPHAAGVPELAPTAVHTPRDVPGHAPCARTPAVLSPSRRWRSRAIAFLTLYSTPVLLHCLLASKIMAMIRRHVCMSTTLSGSELYTHASIPSSYPFCNMYFIS
ncbi:hypothetical protein DFH08DRAFT_948109 [Mycena albidolilacea]|uniref:Uncharacterized protein n=1 Tax=Mycena albidolilacea TaxID=1033008 RepID=A0AAD7AQC3_9AGAR|nr:hypothetical protein DFH08DRAFT_948109 [Mycena albidolilacea]